MKKINIDNILRMFTSRYQLLWVIPEIKKELCNYFNNYDVSRDFLKHGLKFENDKDLYRFLSKGRLTSLTPEILAKATCFCNDIKDIDAALRNQTYSQAYKEIEHKLEKGSLVLEAPIAVKFKDGSYCIYSGRKRIYLARKNGIIVKYYLVVQSKP